MAICEKDFHLPPVLHLKREIIFTEKTDWGDTATNVLHARYGCVGVIGLRCPAWEDDSKLETKNISFPAPRSSD